MEENWMAMISAAPQAGQQQQQEEEQEQVLIIALIRKMAPIMCTLINKFRSASSLLPISQETSLTNDDHHADPTTITTTTLLGEGEYIRGSGLNPDEDEHLLQCVICLYEVIRGEKYRVLQGCKHGFHTECIDAWLQNNSSCPLCRCPVPYASAKPQQQVNNEEEDHQALQDAMLSCFLTFLDHFWRWFVNPLGFDDEPACDQDPNYVI